MAAIRSDLIAHLGGVPSIVQEMLIERAARLTLRLALADQEMLSIDQLPERQGREYLALANSLNRLLRVIGIKGAPERPRSLQDIAADRRTSS